MNIQQAQTDLSVLGTLNFCDVSGENDQNFLIALTDFTYSTTNLNAIVVCIETHLKDVYPGVDHWGFDKSAQTVKIQLNKIV